MRILRTLLLASALTVPGSAYADRGEIVVTSRGLEEGLGERVFDVVTIGRERLNGSERNRLEHILGDIAGFQNFRRSDARSANPTSQGATLRALGGNASSRALLVLDGVPQTDPFGGWIYWPAYDPRRLSSARIVRGGGSGVYGPGALAGTIELSSAGPDDVDGPFGAIAYGSRESIDAFAGLAGNLGQGFGTASASYARGDGFIPTIASQRGAVDRRSPYEQASVALRGIAPIGEDLELQASTLWFSDRRERGTAFTRNDTTGTDASIRLVGQGIWPWSVLGYIQDRNYYNSFASVNASRNLVTQASEQYSVPSRGYGARAEVRPPLGTGAQLRLGADWRRTDGRTKELYSFVNGAGTRNRVAGGETQTYGGFVEASFERGPVTITGAARLDRWEIENGILHEHVLATGAVLTDTEYPDRSGWEPTARTGIAWHPAAAVTLRSAAYLGWRLPTLNELYRPFRVGADATAANALLAPERLKGVEAGVDFRPLSTARLGLTLFANRLRDAIANVTLGQGPGVFPGVGFVASGGNYSQRQNLDAIDAWGVELDGNLKVGHFTLAASYAHVRAEVKAIAAALILDGRRPAQTPRDTASATLAWQSASGAAASVTARYIGMQPEDDLGTRILPDATTLDAACAFPLWGRLSIEARAENITDARVVAGISGAGIIERATPRTFWIGLRLGG